MKHRFLPFDDFPAAGESTLEFVKGSLGFSHWAVARKDGDNWVALRVLGNAYPIEEGTELRWEDSICSRMIEEGGPLIAPDVDDVPAYRDARLRVMLPIRAYAGVPIHRPDGTIFGTIWGADPDPQPAEIAKDTRVLEFVARVLNTVLASDMRIMDEALRAERMRVESLVDPATGLGNRRYWTHLLSAEESRCERYGADASVVMLDVNSAASTDNGELLRQVGNVLRNASRSHDVQARIGGNSLALLAVGCDRTGANVVARRLRSALRNRGVGASIGVASRQPNSGLQGAWQDADTALRRSKKRS